MKVLTILAALGAPLLPSAFAQLSTSFTSAEGYASGQMVNATSAGLWSPFPVDNTDPTTFVVDASGAGTLSINPEVSGFRQLLSTVAFSGASFSGQMDFSLNFTVGGSASISTPVFLPRLQLRNATIASPVQSLNSGLRQTGVGTFNLSSFGNGNGFVGTNAFSTGFTATALGLSVDGSNNWLDGSSDMLRLSYSYSHQGSNVWGVVTTLTNLTTSTQVASIASTFTDNLTYTVSNKQFALLPENTYLAPVTILVDNISLAAIPEPGSFALVAGAVMMGFASLRRRRREV